LGPGDPGLLIGASTGEGPYLEPGERHTLLKEASKTLGKRAYLSCGVAAFAAHAAARAADQAAARAAARAAGHAAATAHVAGHAGHAATYTVTATTYAAVPIAAAATAKERDWQFRHLSKHLRPVVFPARGNN
jgi:hypothetical protein